MRPKTTTRKAFDNCGVPPPWICNITDEYINLIRSMVLQKLVDVSNTGFPTRCQQLTWARVNINSESFLNTDNVFPSNSPSSNSCKEFKQSMVPCITGARLFRQSNPITWMGKVMNYDIMRFSPDTYLSNPVDVKGTGCQKD